MIHKRPEKDTVNPPGQIVYADVDKPRGRYLRDVIERIQKEEAREPLVSAEKRLEGLKQALLGLCDKTDKQYADEDGFVTYGLVSTKLIRDVLEKY